LRLVDKLVPLELKSAIKGIYPEIRKQEIRKVEMTFASLIELDFPTKDGSKWKDKVKKTIKKPIEMPKPVIDDP
jgi:hypothetical protein